MLYFCRYLICSHLSVRARLRVGGVELLWVAFSGIRSKLSPSDHSLRSSAWRCVCVFSLISLVCVGMLPLSRDASRRRPRTTAIVLPVSCSLSPAFASPPPRAAPARASQSLSSIASVRVGFQTFSVSVRACLLGRLSPRRGCELQQQQQKILLTHSLSYIALLVGKFRLRRHRYCSSFFFQASRAR